MQLSFSFTWQTLFKSVIATMGSERRAELGVSLVTSERESASSTNRHVWLHPVVQENRMQGELEY